MKTMIWKNANFSAINSIKIGAGMVGNKFIEYHYLFGV